VRGSGEFCFSRLGIFRCAKRQRRTLAALSHPGSIDKSGIDCVQNQRFQFFNACLYLRTENLGLRRLVEQLAQEG
jgi:hypothetical protein